MDAAALLKSQGWRGKGFSLHPTDNKIGLAKPLLISRNTDGRGVGQKQHYTSDQWWLNAFDEKLKGLDTSKKGAVVQSVAQGKLDLVVNCGGNGKYAGLYTSFVRGETMKSTIAPDAEESTDATPESDDRERPRRETKDEKRARRAARALSRTQKAAKKAAEAEALRKISERAANKELKRQRKANETKEERRARKAERRARKEARRKLQVDSKGG
ncbi:hypothetical protein OQA88_3972 [Cercophora sp. LCS_1]